MYNEIIYLVREIRTEEKDQYGDPVTVPEYTKLFAKVKSIGQKEFYQAQTAGAKPEIKFVIPDCLDYSGQQQLIYGDIRYQVLRTYQTDKNELEITCYGGVRNVSAAVSG